jgi:hypothetical protein
MMSSRTVQENPLVSLGWGLGALAILIHALGDPHAQSRRESRLTHETAQHALSTQLKYSPRFLSPHRKLGVTRAGTNYVPKVQPRDLEIDYKGKLLAASSAMVSAAARWPENDREYYGRHRITELPCFIGPIQATNGQKQAV